MVDEVKNPPIAKGECHDCGGEVIIKLNKHRKAYYFCQECSGHARFSTATSRKLIKLNAGGQNEQISTDQREHAANDNVGTGGTGSDRSGFRLGGRRA